MVTCFRSRLNMCKNRYTDVLCLDHSRVVLRCIDDDPSTDYINANFVDGYRQKNAYISTQGGIIRLSLFGLQNMIIALICFAMILSRNITCNCWVLICLSFAINFSCVLCNIRTTAKNVRRFLAYGLGTGCSCSRHGNKVNKHLFRCCVFCVISINRMTSDDLQTASY